MATKILTGLANSKEGYITTSFSADYGARGRKWMCNSKFELAKNTSVYFLLDLSNLPVDKVFIIDPIIFSSNKTEVEMIAYENTDYTGGNVFQCRNVNRRIENPDVYDYVLTIGATGTNKGTQFAIHTAFGSSGNPAKPSNTGTSRNTSPYFLNTDYNYLLEFKNVDTSDTTTVEFEGFLYES